MPIAMLQLLTRVPFLFTLLRTLLFAVAESFFHILGKKIPRMSKKYLQKYEVPEEYHDLLTPSVRFSQYLWFLPANIVSIDQDANDLSSLQST
jgi:hypothetical protein